MDQKTDNPYLKSILKQQKKWIRTGKCKPNCGLCCSKTLGFKTSSKDGKTMSLKLAQVTENACPLFNKKTKKCDNHGLMQPMVCVLFPWSPDCIPENIRKKCGYKFKRRKK